MEYRYFGEKRSREELLQICASTADYIDREGVVSVVLMDRGARLAGVGLHEYYRTHRLTTTPPRIFYVNPYGFQTGDDSWRSQSTESVIAEELAAGFPLLCRDRVSPVLLFDACIHTGCTIKPVWRELRRCGFADVRVGAAHADVYEVRGMRIDLSALPTRPYEGCCPFNYCSSVTKEYGSLKVKRNGPGMADLRHSLAVRREISAIMQEEAAALFREAGDS